MSFRKRVLQAKQAEEEEENMQFVKKSAPKKFSPLQAILPLVRVKLPVDDEDKSKFITFDLKVRAGAAAGSPNYKKSMRVFEEGSPQEWMDVLAGIREIWRQNTVNGPNDRAATIVAILKGDSLTAFEAALEDVRINPDPNQEDPVPMTIEHIEIALRAVTNIVFPHRALEIQKLWMTRAMRKPFDLTTRKTAAALSRINNCLPLFPLGVPASKFTENELVGLIEWALPQEWRRSFDLKGYVPSLFNRERLMIECEAIERNEGLRKDVKNEKNDNNKNNKKVKFAKSENKKGKSAAKVNGSGEFFCKECGRNPTHATVDCYVLKNRAKREQREQHAAFGDGKAQAKPFSKRTFRKEVNAMARKASKEGSLDLYASALKREQGKAAKRDKKVAAKRKAAESSDSESEESVHLMEDPIPRKKKAKTSIFASLKDAESSEDEEWSDKDKHIRDMWALEGHLYDRKTGIAFIGDNGSNTLEGCDDEEKAFLIAVHLKEAEIAEEEAAIAAEDPAQNMSVDKESN